MGQGYKTCPCGREFLGPTLACGRCQATERRSARQDPRSPQARGRQLERREAARRGVRPQPGSGNRFDHPADMVVGNDLIEHKATQAESYRLTLVTWRKLCQEAALVGRQPVLVVNIAGTRLEVRSAP